MAPRRSKTASTKKSATKKRQSKPRKRTPAVPRTPVKREQETGGARTPETPPRDKYELSPTSLAKCRKCRRKIMKGSRRVGIQHSSPRFGTFHEYYHDECLPISAKQNLRLGGATPQQLISQQLQQYNESQILLRQRQVLRENLRLLRTLFATRLNYASFCVFKDETLDELVVKMPRTEEELLAVRGMGPKKFQSFGDPILRVIADYRKSIGAKKRSSNEKPRKKGPVVIDLVGDTAKKTRPTIQAPARAVDDDGIVVGASMTMEQIVEEKFLHAEKNGYIIAVDI